LVRSVIRKVRTDSVDEATWMDLKSISPKSLAKFCQK